MTAKGACTWKVEWKVNAARAKSVDMIQKELAMHQIAYNLIRLLMWTAAERHAVDPSRLSFAGTQQRVLAILPVAALLRSAREQAALAAPDILTCPWSFLTTRNPRR